MALSRSSGLTNGGNPCWPRQALSLRFRLFRRAAGRRHAAHRGGRRYGIGAGAAHRRRQRALL